MYMALLVPQNIQSNNFSYEGHLLDFCLLQWNLKIKTVLTSQEVK